ncbi:MAG: YeeE/YedE family protein [Opitutales bacterium]|nr:YeeE/YedE family protein [Opitutales bacterium]MCH8541206.1 YeeE/YedE family protein [Opitutales bacterium]
MFEEGEHIRVVLWGGAFLGLLFGAVAQRLEFCISGGLREWWRENDPRRAAAVLLALAVVILGTQFLAGTGRIDLSEALYYQPVFSWLLIPFGGLLFGYGMILARGCGSRALVLLGDGNLRSLVVLLSLAIGAGMVLTGPLASWRQSLAEKTSLSLETFPPAIPHYLGALGLPSTLAWVIPSLLLAGLLLWAALGPLGLRKHPWQMAGAVAIGLLIPTGWFVTSVLGADDFDPVRVESLTFVAPITDSLQYLLLSTGLSASFGITVVAGILVGALITSLATRSFELRSYKTPGETLRSLGGGLLMGIGGPLALGCSVGQGLTGLGTLALSSFLAVTGILLGALLALRGPLWTRDP